jgi:pimeloyl-ACP methyl ester carboxylesterase
MTASASHHAEPAIAGHTAALDRLRVHYLTAGTGEPVVLLHGAPQTSHMWRPLMTSLARRYRVIAPDLRGAGGTQVTEAGYDKRSMAADVHQLLEHLDASQQVAVVGHDMGAGVAYAYAAAHRDQVRRLAFMEFGLAGFGLEQAMVAAPDMENWQLAFFASAPDMAERLFTGRERDLLAWYFNHSSDNPNAVGPADFEVYARELTKPGALRAMIRYFAATWTDAEHNRQDARTKLAMPVLAVGGARNAGPRIRTIMEQVADDVRGAVVEGAGHWLADEQPDALRDLLTEFLR